MIPECRFIAVSDSQHLQPIFAGFSLLHAQKIIRLEQTLPKQILKNNNWIDQKFYRMKVVINDAVSVCYDVHDSRKIDEDLLRDVNFYFKRSYDAQYISQLENGKKVYPLGLNYQVTSDKPDLFRLQRASFYGGKEKIKHILKSLRLDNYLKNSEVERLDNMQAAPDFAKEPRVLFMARVWNTQNLPDQSQRQIVEKTNETRAATIRVLRETFGDKFFGGISRDEFSEKHFKDVLLPDNSLSNKRNYLAMLKNFPICVATTGLNDSIGWKFAEYVTFSKAIISEPLKYEVTGDFRKGKNYLEFENDAELVNSIERLMTDDELRNSMMQRNFEYYQNYLKPDKLILNTLQIVAAQTNLSLS